MNVIKDNANKMIAMTGEQAHLQTHYSSAKQGEINHLDLLQHAQQLHEKLSVHTSAITRQTLLSGIAFPHQGQTFFYKVMDNKLAVIDELGYLIIEGNIKIKRDQNTQSSYAQNKIFQPALVGYFVLELAYGDNGDLPSDIVCHPVIVWAIDNDPESVNNFLIPEAILLGGGVESGSGHLVNAPLLCPDGIVRLGCEAQWDNEQDYLNDCIRQKQEELQYKADIPS